MKNMKLEWVKNHTGVVFLVVVVVLYGVAEFGIHNAGVPENELGEDGAIVFYVGLFTGFKVMALALAMGFLIGQVILLRRGMDSGKAKDSKREPVRMDDEAVSPVIGVILMVAVTVTLAAIVFVIVSDLGVVEDQAPRMAFRSDGDAYVVHSATDGVAWEELDVEGCLVVPTGVVEAGDRIQDCTDPVTVRHIPSNSLVWSS